MSRSEGGSDSRAAGGEGIERAVELVPVSVSTGGHKAYGIRHTA